ncbi:MAG: DUF2891 domain-containing protein [bacterium]|nr:DUF2891 domain-containing protein [bacterium]
MRHAILQAGLLAGLLAGTALGQPPGYTADQAAVHVQLALDCAEREYPNQIQHVMASDADLGPPRALHPAFHGCYDWHSAVHGHWLLARFARLHPAHPLAERARAVLDHHLTAPAIAAEAAYLRGEGREPWQRPYGLAWVLQLAAELAEWDDPAARRWADALAPLAAVCIERFSDWLPKLAYPIRTGEHSQTAFAFGLVLDYARATGRTDLADLVAATSRRLYAHDRGADLAFEPSGQDFLSPALAEADLMRRVLDAATFATWLAGFLPAIPADGGAGFLPVAVVTDRVDGKLAHLDGLNLSRAWMLEGIAAALPGTDPRRPALLAAALAHARDGLASVTGEHYAGGHWLGTYAMYLTSGRGQERADR